MNNFLSGILFSILFFSHAINAKSIPETLINACEAALTPELREQIGKVAQAKNLAQLLQLRAQLFAALRTQFLELSDAQINEAVSHVLNKITQGADSTSATQRGSEPPFSDRSSLPNVKLSDLIKDIVATKYKKSVVIVFDDGDLVCVGEQSYCEGLEVIRALIKENGGVDSIFTSSSAYAVLTNNGKFFCWGTDFSGGNCEAANKFLELTEGANKFTQVYYADNAFAALTNNGKLFCWGDPDFIGSCEKEAISFLKRTEGASHFTQVYSTGFAFAALTDNGQLFCWGHLNTGGKCENNATDFLKNTIDGTYFTQVFSTNHAFVALTNNGNIFCWGLTTGGGKCKEETNDFLNDTDGATKFTQVYSTNGAFAALTNNGKLFCWGADNSGGDCENNANQFLKDIKAGSYFTQVYSTTHAFAALTNNGKLFCWGTDDYGVECGNINYLLMDDEDHIEIITSTKSAFVLKTKKGHVYIWAEIGGTKYRHPTKIEGLFLNILTHGLGILLQKKDLSFTVLGDFGQDIHGAIYQKTLEQVLSTEDSP